MSNSKINTQGNCIIKHLLTCKPTTTTPDTTRTPIAALVNLLGRRASFFSGSALDGKWCLFAVEFQLCAILDVHYCVILALGFTDDLASSCAGTTHADNTPVISERVWSGHMTVKWISCTDNHRSTCQTSHLPPIGVTMARWSFCWNHIFLTLSIILPSPKIKIKTTYKILVSFISPSFGWWCQKSQTIFYGLPALYSLRSTAHYNLSCKNHKIWNFQTKHSPLFAI